MKKYLLVLVSFLMLACFNDVEGKLCQKWDIVEQGRLPKAPKMPISLKWGYYHFQRDYSFIHKGAFGSKTKGDWYVDGHNLTMTLAGETKVFTIKEIGQEKLELTTEDFYISLRKSK
ncbi:hypothetical protein ACFQ1M_12340 [Sungkyunkwania multivorans]|uniref:Lipocalin-like domain-containing protein n=1 Tax=Sungkyunkwania multivorans TaxID=1173618 RepID=A0ABW3D1Q8_9FLAO